MLGKPSRAKKDCLAMGCILKDSFKGRNDFSLLPFSYKVLGYPKELENVDVHFPCLLRCETILILKIFFVLTEHKSFDILLHVLIVGIPLVSCR